MVHLIGSHYVELAAAAGVVFMLTLGAISIMDAVKHRSS